MAERSPGAAYRTRLGRAYQGDALEVLRRLPARSVSLVLTSPPFALRRPKAYGNPGAADYAAWFLPVAREVHRVLRDDGSLVLELGCVWSGCGATRDLMPYRLLLRLCETFHLAQEFFHYNPAKLPTPAEWVTVRRTRVKEAVAMVWWLSKTPEPAADNRRVLTPYSKSMKRLLRDGYQAARRPSQHAIGPRFAADQGGAIPPNVLTIPNTRSQDEYLRRCRAAGLTPHPARFPPELPDFFIRFLTRPGDLVLDPFAGSNTTGRVAEDLGRRWLSVEVSPDYVAGSALRFAGETLKERKVKRCDCRSRRPRS